MDFNSDPNHYELLDLSPDASPQEIRAAYMRAKATYQKDSLALYSLMDPAEAQDMVQKIERAYQTLSHPDRKRVYDRNYLTKPSPTPASSTGAFGATRDKIVSIDRVPPMESSTEEDLLVPPTTDYRPDSSSTHSFEAFSDSRYSPETRAVPESSMRRDPDLTWEQPAAAEPVPPSEEAASAEGRVPSLDQIEEWSGEEIRRIRELKDFPIERLVEITRIRRSYIAAVEQEDYAKLPAAVFVRGFLQQISRELKLPTERVVRTYIARMEKWAVSQSGKSR